MRDLNSEGLDSVNLNGMETKLLQFQTKGQKLLNSTLHSLS